MRPSFVRHLPAVAMLLLAACATPLSQPAPSAVAQPPAPPVPSTIVVTIPPDTPAGLTVFVAGNFNGWNPRERAWALVRQADGTHAIAFPDSVRGAVEFKFTLGTWAAVEIDSAGGDVLNRDFVIPATGTQVYRGAVLAWRRPGQVATPRAHTVSPNVRILDSAFSIPQLGRRRRVWIYLPPDYATSGRRYPVLYMHDGQNVFDEATGSPVEWGVDETLDRLHAGGDPGAIVVAIDHGGERRLTEYSPWVNAKHGGGEGYEYVEFLVGTLKPYVDSQYRTRPDRLNTGIMGSSMGGLVSLYAALRHPEVFGRAGVFSPSLWFAPEIYALARRSTPMRPDPRIYFLMGGRETPNGEHLADQRRMIDTLAAAGFRIGAEVDSLVRPEGLHRESFWQAEFAAAYRRLFR